MNAKYDYKIKKKTFTQKKRKKKKNVVVSFVNSSRFSKIRVVLDYLQIQPFPGIEIVCSAQRNVSRDGAASGGFHVILHNLNVIVSWIIGCRKYAGKNRLETQETQEREILVGETEEEEKIKVPHFSYCTASRLSSCTANLTRARVFREP